MLMASSVATLHSLGQANLNEMQHDFLVMQSNWHYMTPMALSATHSNDASTDTSTSTKGHMILLKSNLNIPKCNGVTDDTLSSIYFTLLAYAPDQICMSHCTCIPLNCYCIDPTLQHISVKQNKETEIRIYHAIVTYVPTINMPLKCHI